MESKRIVNSIAVLVIAALASNAIRADASDPDILKDFLVPPILNPDTITSQYFTFTGFRQLDKANLTGKTAAFITKATKKEFPALEGQGVSVSSILYPPSGMNLPHIHPRAAELLMVLEGIIEVGLIDSTNKLFKQTLRAPDMFIFPKGLVHYQLNTQSDKPAVALALFGSANAGTVSLPKTLFGSGISTGILAKAFKADGETIAKLVEANE